MRNFTQNPAYFQFTLFTDYGRLRYLFFTLCSLVYVMIISANMVIIVTILLEKSLHQPMYIFICCLTVNSLYGSAGFFPRFLADLLSGSHLISYTACFIQMYVIYTYASCEFTILGIMAYDRFVAICQPLHYHTKMTIRKTVILWGIAVTFSNFIIGYSICLTSELPICENKIPRIYCSNLALMKNSCGDTTHGDILGYVIFATTVFMPLLYVLYTYVRILIVCKKGSAEYLMVPSMNNPLIYGLKLPQIRAAVSRRFNIRTKFTLFTDYGRLRYLFFLLSLLIYMMIISANMVIIVTILLEKALHQPMYIFICCLSINSLYGSAGFFPRAVVNISCGDSTHGDIVGYFIIFSTVFIPLFFVIYSYIRILVVCKEAAPK
ncbi:hypothetical protein WMY93_002011 [Mugilogobius chulae]|uniref:Olfactory receptor n=1 Tax=Mugilogobius chulae TaxID=88201 RepID=A0AAW0PUN5_9GOBI